MKPMLIPLCAAALAAAVPLQAQEFGAEVPPLPSRVTATGRTMGDAGSRAILSAGHAVGEAGNGVGNFFARGGKWIGRTFADLSVGLGRSCRRAFVSIFTDFQEKPAGTPLRYDQM